MELFKLALVSVLAAAMLQGTLAYCNLKHADPDTCRFGIQCYYTVREVAFPRDCANRTHIDLTLRSAARRHPPYVPAVSFLGDVSSFLAAGNNWTQLPRDALHRMPRLHMLQVSDNQIGYIFADTFSNLVALRSLDLSSNAISELHPDTFSNTTSLERLFLANNNISYIHGNMLESLSLLQILDLSHNSLMRLDYQAFGGLFGLQILKLNNNYIFSLNGALKHLYQLEHLYLHNNKLHHVDIDEIPNNEWLKTLDVSNNTLSSIPPEAFSRKSDTADADSSTSVTLSRVRASNLDLTIKILLSGNKIDVLKNATFITRPRTTRENFVESVDVLPTEIDLSNNLIEMIEYDAFQGISKLLSLNLSYNRLNDFNVNATNLDKLRFLYMQGNHINVIDVQAFYNLRNLVMMDLSENKINFIKENGFLNLRYLTNLNLSYNSLTKLDSSSMHLRSLNVLDLSNNNFVQVSISPLHLESLKRLSLQYNNISELSLVRLEYLLELDSLDLSHNIIKSLDRSVLAHLDALKHLNLSSNMINNIEASTFYNVRGLLTLDLSSNKMTRLVYGMFDGLTKLSDLNLSDNRIDFLDSKVLFDLKSLRSLSLERNRLQSMDVEVWKGRRVPLRVNVGGNRLRCTWLATVLGAETRGWSGVQLTSAGRARRHVAAGSAVVGGITCEEDDAAQLLNSPPASYDDRLLFTNQKILDAILTQTVELKKSLKIIQLWKKKVY